MTFPLPPNDTDLVTVVVPVPLKAAARLALTAVDGADVMPPERMHVLLAGLGTYGDLGSGEMRTAYQALQHLAAAASPVAGWVHGPSFTMET